MSDDKIIKDPITGAETTGHVWDDDLREFNNPLPNWWLWAFYGTFIFSIIYWIWFPAWPSLVFEKGFSIGTKTIEYKSDSGEVKTTHWNTRALLAHEMQNDKLELKRQEMVKAVAATPFEKVAADAEMSQFTRAYGKTIFGDYCAPCHQQGGTGIVGFYPNLADDAWLWGGDIADMETSIRKGRKGNMPGHKDSLTSIELSQVSHYVLSLSEADHADKILAASGKEVFNTKGCSSCHTAAATGMKQLGSANLTDKIWTQADVHGAKTSSEKVDVIKAVITSGIQREMPAWESRLSDDEIKVLVAYIKLLAE